MVNRITIIGNAASGKSTLAVMLGEKLGLPVYHLDKLLWKEGWVRTPEDEFTEKHQEILRKEKWIIDGAAYASTHKARFNRAEIIVFLDLPVEVCIQRAIKRTKDEEIGPNPYVNKNCSYANGEEAQAEVIRMFQNDYRPKLLETLERFQNKLIVMKEFDEKKEKHIKNLLNEIDECVKKEE